MKRAELRGSALSAYPARKHGRIRRLRRGHTDGGVLRLEVFADAGRRAGARHKKIAPAIRIRRISGPVVLRCAAGLAAFVNRPGIKLMPQGNNSKTTLKYNLTGAKKAKDSAESGNALYAVLFIKFQKHIDNSLCDAYNNT